MDTTLAWIANAITIVGLYYMSPKRRWPFLLIALSETLYMAVSVVRLQAEWVFICAIFLGMAIRNYSKWGSES